MRWVQQGPGLGIGVASHTSWAAGTKVKTSGGLQGATSARLGQTQSCSDCFLFGKENKSEHWAVLVATSMTSPYAQLLVSPFSPLGLSQGCTFSF